MRARSLANCPWSSTSSLGRCSSGTASLKIKMWQQLWSNGRQPGPSATWTPRILFEPRYVVSLVVPSLCRGAPLASAARRLTPMTVYGCGCAP
eukprot:scaffold13021_cov127-Isochrysis_galbana.AAC.8